MNKAFRVVVAGLSGGFAGNAVLGVLFTSPFVQALLYNPDIQSQLFLDITPLRNVAVSVTGLVVLSILHAWLFYVLKPSIPGRNWIEKGLFWGFVIWLMFWLFQEWFVYYTLLQEPIVLALLELLILLFGSLVEGIVIAYFLERKTRRSSRRG